MKRLIFISLMSCCTLLTMYAQSVNSVFFLNDLSQRHRLNASFAPRYGYFSLPIVGNTGFTASSNSGLSNYVFKYQNEYVTFMHSSVDGQDFLSKLQNNTYFNQTLEVDLLSFGFKTRSGFWTFDCTMKENMDVNIPLDFFRLAKLGFAHATNYYDLKNISLDQSNYGEIAVGYSTELNSQWRVGATIKALAGFSTEHLNYSKFDVTLTDSKYTVDATGESMVMSNDLSFNTDENNRYDITSYKLNLFGKRPAGLGMAIDLGTTYKPTNKLTLSAAVNDLGFLAWASRYIQKGKASGNIEFTGFTNVGLDSINMDDQLTHLKNQAKSLILFDKAQNNGENKTERVPCTINLAAEYLLLGNEDRNIRGGLLWNYYNSATYSRHQLMAALTFKAFKWLSASATYSVPKKESNRLGVAFNFSPGWINFFAASDFATTRLNKQLLPINRFDMNFQAGFSLYMGN